MSEINTSACSSGAFTINSRKNKTNLGVIMWIESGNTIKT